MADDRVLPSLKSRFVMDTGDLERARGELGNLKQSVAGAGKDAPAAGKQIDQGLLTPMRLLQDTALTFAATKIFDFGKAGFDELKEAQGVMALTEAHLKSTDGVAGVTADSVANLAGELSSLSGVDDEVIQSGENMLLTFTSVRNEVGKGNDIFDQATQAALDLSVSGFGSMESASVMLGKALQDPIKGMTALGRAGVTFSQDQKDAVAQLVETGQTLDAQKLILKAVEEQVGGTAKEFGDSLPGQVQKAENSLDEMRASIVAGGAPALSLLAGLVTDVNTKVTELPEPVRTAIGVVGLLGGGIGSLIRPVSDAVNLLRALRAGHEAAATAAQTQGAAETVAAAATTAASTASSTAALAADAAGSSYEATTAAIDAMIAGEVTAEAAGVGLTAALGPLGLALAAAAAAYTLFGSGSSDLDIEGLDEEVKQLTKDLQDLDGDALTHVKERLSELLDTSPDLAASFADMGITTNDFASAVAGGQRGLVAWIESMRDSGQITKGQALELATLAEQQENAAKAALDSLQANNEVTAAQREQAEAANTSADGYVNYIGVLEDLKPVQKDTKEQIALTEEEIQGLNDAQSELLDALDQIADGFKKAYGGQFTTLDLQADLADQTRRLTQSIKDNGLELDVTKEKGAANLEQLQKTGEAVVSLGGDYFAQTHDIEGARKKVYEYVDGLRETLRHSGLTRAQVDKLIATMHLTPGEIDTQFSTNSPMVQAQIQGVLDKLNDIPADKRTKIQALIDKGKYDEAAYSLAILAADRKASIKVVLDKNEAQLALLELKDKGILSRPFGGNAQAGLPYIVGDSGGLSKAELFVPSESGYIYPRVPGAGDGGVTIAEGAVQVAVSASGSMTAYDLTVLRKVAGDAVQSALEEVLL